MLLYWTLSYIALEVGQQHPTYCRLCTAVVHPSRISPLKYSCLWSVTEGMEFSLWCVREVKSCALFHSPLGTILKFYIRFSDLLLAICTRAVFMFYKHFWSHEDAILPLSVLKANYCAIVARSLMHRLKYFYHTADWKLNTEYMYFVWALIENVRRMPEFYLEAIA